VNDCYAQLYGSGSLWVDHFLMHELTQIMRQTGGSAFSKLLCRVRTDGCTSEDIRVLKSREMAADAEDYPTHMRYMFTD